MPPAFGTQEMAAVLRVVSAQLGSPQEQTRLDALHWVHTLLRRDQRMVSLACCGTESPPDHQLHGDLARWGKTRASRCSIRTRLCDQALKCMWASLEQHIVSPAGCVIGQNVSSGVGTLESSTCWSEFAATWLCLWRHTLTGPSQQSPFHGLWKNA